MRVKRDELIRKLWTEIDGLYHQLHTAEGHNEFDEADRLEKLIVEKRDGIRMLELRDVIKEFPTHPQLRELVENMTWDLRICRAIAGQQEIYIDVLKSARKWTPFEEKFLGIVHHVDGHEYATTRIDYDKAALLFSIKFSKDVKDVTLLPMFVRYQGVYIGDGDGAEESTPLSQSDWVIINEEAKGAKAVWVYKDAD